MIDFSKVRFDHFSIYIYNNFQRPIIKLTFKRNLKNNTPKKDYKNYYTEVTRQVEILEEDKQLDEVIFTCYFTKKADPQYGIIRLTPDISYIAPWYDSIVNQKLNGIVIHDGLHDEFISKYQNQFVKFRKYSSGNYSIFEERWIAYYMFLSNSNIKKAFFTDANDVYITSDPFKFAKYEYALYIGRDNANKIKYSEWLLNELNTFIKDSDYKLPQSFTFQYAYNAGIVGGSKTVLLFFLARIIDMTLMTKTSCHKDMTLVNLVIHRFFSPKLIYIANEPKLTNSVNDFFSTHKNLITGFPLCSDFKKNQLDSKAYFIHK